MVNNSVLQAYVGNFLLKSDQQNLLIPFNFIVTSNLFVSLLIQGFFSFFFFFFSFKKVVDEYTYYASGSPKVSDSTVKLFDTQGNLIIFGVTPPNGILNFPNIREGFEKK